MLLLSRALSDDFETNCYIVACPVTRACAVIDPGTPDPWIQRTLTERGLKVVGIWLTHGHLDHIGGVAWLKEATGAPVCIHPGDAPMLTNARLNGSAFFGTPVIATPPDHLLQDGEELQVGNILFQVLHTPGHTQGGCCLYTPGHLFSGDTLFAGSIGRTDLQGGSFEQLIHFISSQLLVLPDETQVYPGHGPSTSIGDEKESNPFL